MKAVELRVALVMKVVELRVALAALDQIDIEVSRAKETHAKFESACQVGPTRSHWLLNSPPGHLSMADVERLRQLRETLDVAERCKDAAAVAKALLAKQLSRQLEDAA
jgi:hypothetical protein